MIAEQHIANFSPVLKTFLNVEIKFGNEIVETSSGWPTEATIIIILKQPFLCSYNLDNVEYRNIDDLHYWKAEFFDKSTGHILACKF